MFEFPVLFGVPQSMNPEFVLFAAAWAVATAAGCVAFLVALARQQRRSRPEPSVAIGHGGEADETFYRAA
jgi:hypothetical protein